MDHREKLLFILRDLGFGGAERQIVELCQGLDKNQFQVTVILFFYENGYLSELKDTGVEVIVLATKANYKWAALPKLLRILKTRQFACIQTMLPIGNFLGGLAVRMSGQGPVIGSLRNANPFSWLDIFCLMDTIALNLFSDVVVANSKSGQRMGIKNYRLPESKIKVIRNGRNFNQKSIEVNHESFKQELGIPEGQVVIAAIGRITRQKGYPYLLEAVRILVKERKQAVCLLIVGKAEESMKAVEKKIKKDQLESSVLLLGVRQDVPKILAVTDVFVLASLWEGIANVLLEAMVAQVPIVASDIEPNREVLEHEKSGLLVTPQNPTAIADAVERIIKDWHLAQELTANAFQVAQQQFSLEQMVSAYTRLYAELVAI